jgi:ABC-type dipeptide/oligopeptide/nickel transport system permease component
MTRYIGERLLQMLAVALLATVAIFMIVHVLPGDAALVYAGPNATNDVIEAVRHDMGLDQPLPLQYLVWLAHLLRGDLGRSYVNHYAVSRLLAQRLPVTAELAVGAILLSLLGAATGVVAAVRRGSALDYAITSLNSIGLAVPPFWFGLLLIMLFSLEAHWLPASGFTSMRQDFSAAIKHLVLPTVTLAFQVAAILSRFMKSAVTDVLEEDYLRTARSKGAPERLVRVRHILPNAMVTFTTVLGLQFGRLLGGAVVIESVFAWPGVGRLLLDALGNRDYLVIQGGLLFFVLLFLLINLVTDLAYGILDPRVRYT